jgi:hypothetical protein
MEYVIQLVKHSVDNFNIPAFLFGVGMVLFLLVLARWHSDDSKFDFRESLLDPQNNDRVSLSRLGQITALFTSTGVVTFYAINKDLSEWMFGLYMTAWAGTYLATKWSPKQGT